MKMVFTVYQSFMTKSSEEKNVAIERSIEVEDITNLNLIFGAIFQSLFNLMSLGTFVNKRVLWLSQPVFLRFVYNEQVIDTASFEPLLLNSMKLGNIAEKKRRFAKAVWALTMDKFTVHEPVAYVHEKQDIIPVRMLADKQAVGLLEEGIRMTPKAARIPKIKKELQLPAPTEFTVVGMSKEDLEKTRKDINTELAVIKKREKLAAELTVK